MEMPRPGPGHERLELLAGNWVGEENMHPSPWDPAGGTAVGRRTGRVALSGFALVFDYEQERDGAVTYSGHGVMTYNADGDTYTLHWFDSMGSSPEVFEGTFEGDVLTVTHGGPGMHARLTHDLGTPGQMSSKMEMSPDGAEWSTFFDGVYTRS